MITDPETNFLYLADKLKEDYPDFFDRLTGLLNRKDVNIKYGLLPETKDIWARDYMPIQVSKDRYGQFKYDPGY